MSQYTKDVHIYKEIGSAFTFLQDAILQKGANISYSLHPKVPQWPKVAGSIFTGVKMNRFESFKEGHSIYKWKEEIMP